MKRRYHEDEAAGDQFPTESPSGRNDPKRVMNGEQQRRQTEYNRDSESKIDSLNSPTISTFKRFCDSRVNLESIKKSSLRDKEPLYHDNLQDSIPSLDRTLQSKQRDDVGNKRQSNISQDTLEDSIKLDARTVPSVFAGGSSNVSGIGSYECSLSKENSSQSVVQNTVQEAEGSRTYTGITSRNEKITVSTGKSDVKVAQDCPLSKDESSGKPARNSVQESGKKTFNPESKTAFSKDKVTYVERTNIAVDQESSSTSHRSSETIAANCAQKLTKRRSRTRSIDSNDSTIFCKKVKRRKREDVNQKSVSSETVSSDTLSRTHDDSSYESDISSTCDTIINESLIHPEAKVNRKNKSHIASQERTKISHVDPELLIEQVGPPLTIPVRIDITQIKMDVRSTKEQEGSFLSTETNNNLKAEVGKSLDNEYSNKNIMLSKEKEIKREHEADSTLDKDLTCSDIEIIDRGKSIKDERTNHDNISERLIERKKMKKHMKSRRDMYLSLKRPGVIRRKRQNKRLREKFRKLFGYNICTSESEEEQALLAPRYQNRPKQKFIDSDSCDSEDECVKERYAFPDIAEEKITDTLERDEKSVNNSERDVKPLAKEERLRNLFAVVDTENIIRENDIPIEDSVTRTDIHKKDLRTLFMALCGTITEIQNICLKLNKNTQKSAFTQNRQENEELCEANNAISIDKDIKMHENINLRLDLLTASDTTRTDIEKKDDIGNCDVSQNIAKSLLINYDSAIKDVRNAIIDCISATILTPKESFQEDSKRTTNAGPSTPIDTSSEKLDANTNDIAPSANDLFNNNINEIEIELNIKQSGCTKFSLRIPISMTTCNTNNPNILKLNEFLQTISGAAYEMAKRKKTNANDENNTLKGLLDINQIITENTATSNTQVARDSSRTTKDTSHSPEQQDSQDDIISGNETKTMEHDRAEKDECVRSIEQEKAQKTIENSSESSNPACSVSDLGKQLPKNPSDDVRKANEQILNTHKRIRVRSNRELGCSTFMNLDTLEAPEGARPVSSAPSQSATVGSSSTNTNSTIESASSLSSDRTPNGNIPNYESSNQRHIALLNLERAVLSISWNIKCCRTLIEQRSNREQQQLDTYNRIIICRTQIIRNLETVGRILGMRDYTYVVNYTLPVLNSVLINQPVSLAEIIRYAPSIYSEYFEKPVFFRDSGNVPRASSSSASTNVPHVPSSSTETPNVSRPQLSGNTTRSSSTTPNTSQQQFPGNTNNFPFMSHMLRSEQSKLNVNLQSSRNVSNIPPAPRSTVPTTNVERSLRNQNNLSVNAQVPLTDVTKVNDQQFSGGLNNITHTVPSSASISNVNIPTNGFTAQKNTNVPPKTDNRQSMVGPKMTSTRTNGSASASTTIGALQQSQYHQGPSQIGSKTSAHPPPITNRNISPNTSAGVRRNIRNKVNLSRPNVTIPNTPLNLSNAPRTSPAEGSAVPGNLFLIPPQQIPEQIPIVLPQYNVPIYTPYYLLTGQHTSNMPQGSAPNANILHGFVGPNAQAHDTLPQKHMNNVPVMMNVMQQNVVGPQQQPLFLLPTDAHVRPINASNSEPQNLRRSVISDRAKEPRNRGRTLNKPPSVNSRCNKDVKKHPDVQRVPICQDSSGVTSASRPNVSPNMAPNVSSSVRTTQTSSTETHRSLMNQSQKSDPSQLNQIELDSLTDIQKVILYNQIVEYFSMPPLCVPTKQLEKIQLERNLLHRIYQSLNNYLTENIVKKSKVMEKTKMQSSTIPDLTKTQSNNNNENNSTRDENLGEITQRSSNDNNEQINNLPINLVFAAAGNKNSQNGRPLTRSTNDMTPIKRSHSELVKLQEKSKNTATSQCSAISLDTEEKSGNTDAEKASLREHSNISEENSLTEASRKSSEMETQRTTKISKSLAEKPQLSKTSASPEQSTPNSSQNKLADRTKEQSDIAASNVNTKNNNFAETENINESSVNAQNNDKDKGTTLQSSSYDTEDQDKEVCNTNDETFSENLGDGIQESKLNSSQAQFDPVTKSPTSTPVLSNDELELSSPVKRREFVDTQAKSQTRDTSYEEYMLADTLSESGLKVESYDITDEETISTIEDEMYDDLDIQWSIEGSTEESSLDTQRKESIEKDKLNILHDISRTVDTIKREPIKTLHQSYLLKDIIETDSANLCRSSVIEAQDVIKSDERSSSRTEKTQIQESPSEISEDASSVGKSTERSIDNVKQHEEEKNTGLSNRSDAVTINEQFKYASDLEYHEKSQTTSRISAEKDNRTDINGNESIPIENDTFNANVAECNRAEIANSETTNASNILDVRSIPRSLFEKISVDTFSSYDLALSNGEEEEREERESSDINNDPKILDETEDKACLRCKRKSTVCCEICLMAYYCSERCFSLHWNTDHHKHCKPRNALSLQNTFLSTS